MIFTILTWTEILFGFLRQYFQLYSLGLDNGSPATMLKVLKHGKKIFIMIAIPLLYDGYHSENILITLLLNSWSKNTPRTLTKADKHLKRSEGVINCHKGSMPHASVLTHPLREDYGLSLKTYCRYLWQGKSLQARISVLWASNVGFVWLIAFMNNLVTKMAWSPILIAWNLKASCETGLA